jgi:hypothetical protein
MQVGNYNMQTPGGYAGASRGTPANPAGYSGGAATAPHNNAAGQAPYGDDYRTASQANAGHYQGPAGGNAPAENPAAAPGEAESVYNGGETATAHEAGTYSGNEETSPVGGNNSPASGPYTNSPPPESTSNRSFGPANTVGPAARTSTSSTSLGGGLPASLSGNGGYRPGSTAGGYGSRNAGYDQPQNGSATEEPAGGIYR